MANPQEIQLINKIFRVINNNIILDQGTHNYSFPDSALRPLQAVARDLMALVESQGIAKTDPGLLAAVNAIKSSQGNWTSSANDLGFAFRNNVKKLGAGTFQPTV